MALGPIDYVSGLLPTNQSILASLEKGMQFRAGYDKQQAEQQQQAAALAAQQKYEQDKAAALANPTPQAFAALAVTYPQHREAFKQGWDQLSASQQQGELRDASSIAAALQSGRQDVAVSKIDERIAAMKNSGQDTSTLDFLKSQIQADPRKAHADVLNVLAGLPGGDKVLENLGKIGTEARAAEMQPVALATATANASTAQSNAQKSAIEAKYANQAALLDLEKKGWDIKKITADIDIAREANRIAAMNAAANREGNALKREELGLKLQEARSALDDKIRAKVADAESAATNIDNSLNTIQRIKDSKGLREVVGSIEGGKFYPTQLAAAVNALNPLTSGGDDRADAIALIDTLGSQAFLSQAANLKGMGALSNAEGEKLQSALTNLSRQQSEKQFIANLDEAARLLRKGRETLSKRSGVPLASPDIPSRAPLPSGAAPAAPGAALLPGGGAGRPPLDSFFTAGN